MNDLFKKLDAIARIARSISPQATSVAEKAKAAITERNDLLRKCAAQFRIYEENHREKARVAVTEGMNGSMSLMHDEKGSLAKAEVNMRFAEEIEALLAKDAD